MAGLRVPRARDEGRPQPRLPHAGWDVGREAGGCNHQEAVGWRLGQDTGGQASTRLQGE